MAAVVPALTVEAAKPTPSGTIAVAAGSDLSLGGLVTFDWSVANFGGNNPRINVECYQGGTQVLGIGHNAEPQLGDPPFDGASFVITAHPYEATWIDGNTGPADCVATLYYWDFHPVQTFHAVATVAFAVSG